MAQPGTQNLQAVKSRHGEGGISEKLGANERGEHYLRWKNSRGGSRVLRRSRTPRVDGIATGCVADISSKEPDLVTGTLTKTKKESIGFQVLCNPDGTNL